MRRVSGGATDRPRPTVPWSLWSDADQGGDPIPNDGRGLPGGGLFERLVAFAKEVSIEWRMLQYPLRSIGEHLHK